ncbi:proton-translocating NADH-quinone oxidoreductase, chain L [Bacteriovorax sp. BSW11_IV]|uniref:NADH-quinone oxidoreductase subunit L n=1 Tax=Bacteriovorax sp. BSW11_IV TaxID=1353529 RepID=UPI000389EE12|nr:NADH-quinone oxidoreductase subunit L [Bacteriovorax sp. BSW11_IV]EQC47947.1 proton-translocating NADH-quinone oxidoreductase, chain L [Bacteriovorax sp. BSW11_IV]
MDYTISSIAPIVLLPFAAFVINSFIARTFTKTAVALSCGAIFGSFLFAFRIFKDFVFGNYATDYYIHKVFNWFDLTGGGQSFQVNMGVYIDNMTAVMLLMVTAVATLIHVFSTFYMHHDMNYGRNGRFFTYLSLFTSAMLGLVLSDNLLSVFIFWELMGFCSYSLIGFYYEKEGAGNASMKAFMTTRVGDVFFLLGILAVWTTVGSVTFTDIYAALAAGKFDPVMVLGIPLATFAGLCIFAGTMGKSAQFPLQVWLPDAMFGPTPCSALIHAATMVAAGVYLSLRIYPILEAGHLTYFVAVIGGITAFGAATIALVQTDLKAVLAYSTISQLGYMVLGVGVGSYNAAFMHLITHAIFKACLFLSAGSVIHSLHDHHTHTHVQEMPRMGGLKNKFKFTWIAMWCCTLAIAGIPFFSGFVSKDRILGDALLMALHNKAYWIPTILGFAGAFLTAFYMCRMMFLTFHGEPRDKDVYDHAHVEHLSWNQNIPLLILSVFTLGVWFSGSLTGQGLVKVASYDGKYEWFQTLIAKPKVEKFVSYKAEEFGAADTRVKNQLPASQYDSSYGLSEEEAHHIHHVHYMGAIASIIIAFSGVFLAFLMYIRKSVNPGWWVSTFSGWYRALQNRYYFDDFYIKGLIQRGLLPLNNFLSWFDMGVYDRIAVDGWAKVTHFLMGIAKWFDNLVVDTIAVDGTGASVRFFNVLLRTLQSGKIQFYFIMIILVLTGYVLAL